MFNDFSINGQSRLFRVAVICLGITVLISALIGVGSLTTDSNSGGLINSSTDDRDEFLFNLNDEGEPDDEASTDMGDETDDNDNSFLDYLLGNQGENGNNPPHGDDEGDQTGLINQSSNTGDLPRMLDANAFGTGNPARSEDELRERQLDTRGTNSFVNERHFTINSVTNTEQTLLWRTTGYDSYTGETMLNSELESGDVESLRDVPTTNPRDEEQATTELTFDSETSKIPSSGGVTAVEIVSGANENEYSFKQASDGSVVVLTADGREVNELPEGSTVRIHSTSAGDAENTPQEEPQAYTTVPNSLPDRVGEESTEIMSSSGAETNREKADATNKWLQSNKEYRADITHPEGSDRVDNFIFESRGGQSDDFAISSTMLLREQGVPARVVSGYKQSSETQNELGSMDQHTWVEVYDDEQNEWVSYDPTPDERDGVRERTRAGDTSVIDKGVHEDVVNAWNRNESMQVQSDSSNRDSSVAYNNEQVEPDSNGSNDSTSSTSESSQTVDDVSPPFDIAVSSDPTPGGTITVTVSKHGNGVSDAMVTFNGDSVGVTNAAGEVTAQVPYDTELTITAKEPRNNNSDDMSGAFSSVDDDSSETFTLSTEIDFDTSEVFVPGEIVTGEVLVDGTPVPNVNVYLDGRFVGETNSEGEIDVLIPERSEFGEEVVVSVERDAFSGEKTLGIGEPKVRVDESLFSLPFSPVEVSVVMVDGVNERVIENQEVSLLDGAGNPVLSEETVNTGENGVIDASLPVSNSVTASTVVSGVRIEQTVSGILYRFGLGIGFIAVVVGGLGRALWIRGVTIKNISNVFYQVVIRVGDWCVKATSKLWSGVTYVKRKLWGGVLWLRAMILGRDFSRLLLIPRMVQKRWVSVVLLFPSTMRRFMNTVFDWVKSYRNSESQSQTDMDKDESPGSTVLSDSERLLLLWEWFVRQVLHRTGGSHKTSVEIAEEGIQKGLPMGPVTRLRTAFQNVQYGLKEPSDNVDAGEDAVTSLKSVSEKDSNGE